MLVRFLLVLPFMILGGWWVWDGIIRTTHQIKWMLEVRKSDKKRFG